MAMMAAAGAALTAVAAYKSSRAEKEAGRAAQKLYNYNAQVEENYGKQLEKTGTYEGRRKRQQISSLVSQQKALVGASGITFSGTPTRVFAKTASEGEMDAMMIEHNYNLEATKRYNNASILRWQGKTERMLSKRRGNAMLLAGLAGSAAGGYSAYGQYKADNNSWFGYQTT